MNRKLMERVKSMPSQQLGTLGVRLVDAVKIRSKTDLPRSHLRDDGADCSRELLMHLEGFLVLLHTQRV